MAEVCRGEAAEKEAEQDQYAPGVREARGEAGALVCYFEKELCQQQEACMNSA